MHFRCGHCKRMAPAWAELASNLASVESVHIGKLDCTVYRSVCNKYDVHGFPTIKYIKDGKEVSISHFGLSVYIEKDTKLSFRNSWEF